MCMYVVYDWPDPSDGEYDHDDCEQQKQSGATDYHPDLPGPSSITCITHLIKQTPNVLTMKTKKQKQYLRSIWNMWIHALFLDKCFWSLKVGTLKWAILPNL